MCYENEDNVHVLNDEEEEVLIWAYAKKAKEYCVFIFLLLIQCFYIFLEIYKKIYMKICIE